MNVETAIKLVQLRKNHGFSQEDLAEKIGVSRQVVSQWECAESFPDTDNLIALSKLYNITIDEMLNNDISPKAVHEKRDNRQGSLHEHEVERDQSKLLRQFPVAIIVTIVYLLLGFLGKLWHPGWLVFLIIPVYYIIVNALAGRINYKLLKYFSIPVIIVLIYLGLGFFGKLWHPGWIVFLLIPVYYAIIKAMPDRENRKK